MEALEEVILLGGFSGGGRSSGGFSGGRGGSSFGGSFGGRSVPPGGGYRREPRPPRRHHWFGGWFWGPSYYGPGEPPPRRTNILDVVVTIMVLIIIFAVLASLIGNLGGTTVKNTTERTALSGVVNKTDYYKDNLGWITSKNILVSGLEDFYEATGVQPYILLVDYSSSYWNGSSLNSTAATNYLETVYSSTFTDEGHFIFAYFACANDSKSEMEGEFLYLSGYSADTIMDNEAIEILWGYFETNYYNTSLSIEEMFSNTFSQTAESIMSEPTNGWDFLKVLIIIVGIVAVVYIVYRILKNKNAREKEKEEYTKEILDKPLETFGEDTSDIENKYK